PVSLQQIVDQRPPSLSRLRAGVARSPGVAVLGGLPTPACPSAQAPWVRRGPTAVRQRCFRSLRGSLAAAGPGSLEDRLTRTAERNGGNRQASQVPGEPRGGRADF